jgi:hypothetical protein
MVPVGRQFLDDIDKFTSLLSLDDQLPLKLVVIFFMKRWGRAFVDYFKSGIP